VIFAILNIRQANACRHKQRRSKGWKGIEVRRPVIAASANGREAPERKAPEHEKHHETD
jgi:hypothetical protein